MCKTDILSYNKMLLLYNDTNLSNNKRLISMPRSQSQSIVPILSESESKKRSETFDKSDYKVLTITDCYVYIAKILDLLSDEPHLGKELSKIGGGYLTVILLVSMQS